MRELKDNQGQPMPTARVRRFEVVTVVFDRSGVEWVGHRGTAIWCDRPRLNRRTLVWNEWIYCIHFPELGVYRSFRESDLEPTGVLDSEESDLGRGYEISFDCVLEDDNEIVEGCFRIRGRHWEVFAFGKDEGQSLSHQSTLWESGMTVTAFNAPRATILSRDFIFEAMTQAFSSDQWVEVRGPDSMVLR